MFNDEGLLFDGIWLLQANSHYLKLPQTKIYLWTNTGYMQANLYTVFSNPCRNLNHICIGHLLGPFVLETMFSVYCKGLLVIFIVGFGREFRQHCPHFHSHSIPITPTPHLFSCPVRSIWPHHSVVEIDSYLHCLVPLKT